MGESGFKSLIDLPSVVTGTLCQSLACSFVTPVSTSTVTWPPSLRVCVPVSSHDLLIRPLDLGPALIQYDLILANCIYKELTFL